MSATASLLGCAREATIPKNTCSSNSFHTWAVVEAEDAVAAAVAVAAVVRAFTPVALLTRIPVRDIADVERVLRM